MSERFRWLSGIGLGVGIVGVVALSSLSPQGTEIYSSSSPFGDRPFSQEAFGDDPFGDSEQGVSKHFELTGAGSLSALSDSLVINGNAGTLLRRYEGTDATSSAWVAKTGQTATITAGTAPTLGNDTPIPNNTDKSVRFVGATSGSAGYAESTKPASLSRSFAIEVVIRGGTESFGAYAGFSDGVPVAGIVLESFMSSNRGVRARVGDGVIGTDVLANVDAIYPGEWAHVFVVGDYANNAIRVHVNGVTSSGANYAVGMSTIVPANNFSLGQSLASGSPTRNPGGDIAFAAYWEFDEAADLGTEESQEAASAERFYKLLGLVDTVSGAVPTFERASDTYVQKWDGSKHVLHHVASHWPSVAVVSDGSKTRQGYWSFDAVTNLFDSPLTLNDAAWTALDAGDTFGTGTATPIIDQTSSALVADSTDGDHGYSASETLTADDYTLAVFAKAGNKNWLYLSDDTVSNATGYFDLANGELGTIGAAATGFIEDYGDGWYRCAIAFTGTAAAHTFKVQSADADGDKSVVGDGAAINTHVVGASVHLGDQPTTFAEGARSADSLFFLDRDPFGPPYTLVSGAYFGSNIPAANSQFVNLRDNSTGDEGRIITATSPGGLVLRFAGNPDVSVLGSSAVDRETLYDVTVALENDNTRLFVDGALNSTDTDCAPADDLEDFYIGRRPQGVDSHPNSAIVLPLKIYRGIVEP